jgi:hypothetical protein
MKAMKGLKNSPGKPRGNHPNSTDENVVKGILSLKEKHKLWGAKKIHKLLYNDFSDEESQVCLDRTQHPQKTWLGEASKTP